MRKYTSHAQILKLNSAFDREKNFKIYCVLKIKFINITQVIQILIFKTCVLKFGR